MEGYGDGLCTNICGIVTGNGEFLNSQEIAVCIFRIHLHAGKIQVFIGQIDQFVGKRCDMDRHQRTFVTADRADDAFTIAVGGDFLLQVAIVTFQPVLEVVVVEAGVVGKLAQFLISGVITTGTGYIGVPADLGTGGRFRIVVLFIVTQFAQLRSKMWLQARKLQFPILT